MVPQAAVLTRASVRASVRACACAEGGKVAPWVGDDGQTFAMADIWPLTKRHEGGATPACTRDPVPVQMWQARATSSWITAWQATIATTLQANPK